MLLNKKMYFNIILLLLIFTLLFSSISFATNTMYVWSTNNKPLNNFVPVNSTFNEKNSSTNLANLTLESHSGILIEQNSGKILYSHNIHKKLRPASVTKIMTLLLIMEAIDSGELTYTDKIPCTENAAGMGGSQIWLDIREELSVDEMLKAICIVSANDCTVAMAEYLAGSQEIFVQKMNEKAKELGMNDTIFKNCHGIDEDGHLTSVYDVALMSRELLNKHPDIIKYTTIWIDTLRDGKSQLVNTNKLIRNYKGATGLKTGSTSIALYNLSASATRKNLSLIAVIMKAPSSNIRFTETQKLLDYGFSNYSYISFGKKGDILKQLPISKGTENLINAILENDVGAIIPKGKEKDLIQDIQLENSITAPINKGQKLGKITYLLDDEIISTIPIIAEKAIDKNTFVNITKNILKKWFCLLRLN